VTFDDQGRKCEYDPLPIEIGERGFIEIAKQHNRKLPITCFKIIFLLLNAESN
jgi:hypothetical protein